MFDIDAEITVGDQVVGSQHLSAPYQIIIMQCQEVVNQIAQDARPMKAVFRGERLINLQNGDTISKPARLIYANNKYIDNFELNYE